MEGHGPEPDFAVAARSRIESRNRERERRAARRDRRERILLWLLAPLGLPAAGAAAAVAVMESAGGDLSGWSTTSVILLALAVFGVPALLTLWLARHRGRAVLERGRALAMPAWPRRGRVEPFAWAAITLVAEVALLFWVGFVALGYGPE